MVNTSILSGVALATLINVVVVTASKKPSSLDTTVWTGNDTNLIPEEEFDFDPGSSIAKRKKCLATRKCTNAGGSCIKSRANCDGTVDPQGCKGKKCKCCIPKKCLANRKCTNAGGSCIKSRAYCDGTVDPQGCKGKKCKCCIPNQATTTTTCPSCPTQDTTTTTVPAGFEVFHGRVIRRTISSDTRISNWDTAMTFCNQFGAKPFIPRAVSEYTLYKTVQAALGHRKGYMWLPANDRRKEGTLRWYNGKVVPNISLWNWLNGRALYGNSREKDCLRYHNNGAYIWYCTTTTGYPPICEMI